MSVLGSYLLAAMMTWVPIKNHIYEKPEETLERYEKIAETVSEAVSSTNTSSIFSGEDSKIKTALLMLSLASFESHYHRSIYECKKGSPKKVSWGIFQVSGPKLEICANKEVGAKIALGIIDSSFKKCKVLDISDRMSYYTDGSCHRNWARSKVRVNRALNYYRSHPYFTELL